MLDVKTHTLDALLEDAQDRYEAAKRAGDDKEMRLWGRYIAALLKQQQAKR